MAYESTRIDDSYLRDIVDRMSLPVVVSDVSAIYAYFDEHDLWSVPDFDSHLDAHPEILAACVPLMRLRRANPAALDLFELDAGDGLLIPERIFTAGSIGIFRAGLIEIQRQSGKLVAEGDVITPSGNRKTIRYRWLVAPDPERGRLGSVASVEDVTGRGDVEDALHEVDLRDRIIVRSLPAVLLRATPAGRCTYVSRGAERLFGYPLHRWTAEKDFWREHLHPEDREWVIRESHERIRRLDGYELEYRMLRADGSAIWIRDYAQVVAYGDRPVELVGLMLDVTTRHEAEESLREALAEVGRLKDRLNAENVYLREQIREDQGFGEILGADPAMVGLRATIRRVADTDATVLVVGETGTGKELVARALHRLSRRRDRVLVKVNCSAVSAGLVESELFGHVKGAFTGAVRDRRGRFEVADGGTIFLDEIGELPPETQVKLLRVLEEREFERVGSSEPVRVDVRVVVATNRDLEASVAEGRFRSDLYYRLNVFPIQLPPLRDRVSDIPLLAAHFLERISLRLGRRFAGFHEDALDWMSRYDWPGNVRELGNLVERAAILTSEGDLVRLARPPGTPPAAGTTHRIDLESVERDHIRQTLDRTGWVIEGPAGAARLLGLAPSTLRSRMKKLRIRRG